MVRVSVSLPTPLYKRLTKMAKAKDLSLSGMLRHGIEIYADSQTHFMNEFRRANGVPVPTADTPWVYVHPVRPKRKGTKRRKK